MRYGTAALSILCIAIASLGTACGKRPSTQPQVGSGGGWGQGASTRWYLDMHGNAGTALIVGIDANGSA
ncbi:MAG: hypothetical protein O2800_07685, partial [Planctomycetota bacterium]|nr:hypothetical protein [Planctomycetota bacterium]